MELNKTKHKKIIFDEIEQYLISIPVGSISLEEFYVEGVIIRKKCMGKNVLFLDIIEIQDEFKSNERLDNVRKLELIIKKNNSISAEFISKMNEELKVGDLIMVEGNIEHTITKKSPLLHVSNYRFLQNNSSDWFKSQLKSLENNVEQKKNQNQINLELNLQKTKDLMIKNLEIPILWSDENFFAISKPSGHPIHPPGNTISMTETLRDRMGKVVHPVHRLDAATSGIVLFSTSSDSEIIKKMQLSLKDKEKTVKEYVVMCLGVGLEDRFKIDLPLSTKKGMKESLTEFEKLCEYSDSKVVTNHKQENKNERSEIEIENNNLNENKTENTKTENRENKTETEITKTEMSENKTESVTETVSVTSNEKFIGCTLLTARIKTGRYHQIRRHLLKIGHPVVGDPDHGGKSLSDVFHKKYGLKRMFLHSKSLEFTHPITLNKVTIHNSIPVDLQTFLLNLPGSFKNYICVL